MDDLALLARVRDDAPDRSPADVARGRAALLRAIDAPAAPRVRARRSWVWSGSAALATCGLAGTLVVAGLPGTPGGADPAAAAVLSSAALAARTVTDPMVGPGQYLEVRTDAIYAATGTTYADWEVAYGRGENTTADDMTSFLESEVRAIWVPADRSGGWIEVRCAREPVKTFGPRSETLAAEQGGLEQDSRAVYIGGVTDSGSSIGLLNTNDDAEIPRDPALLLQQIYLDNGAAGPSRDGEALVWIADRLRSGTVSAELRSLFYDTAALIPGVTITEDQVTLNGRTGTAIGRDESENGFRQDIVIDPSTGAFIGERQVLLNPVADMPAGTATGFTSVTTTVTDTIPEGTTLCAA